MANEQTVGSAWWGYASSAWNVVQETVQETAKDFTDAFQEENEETIEQIKTKVDTEHISSQISNATTSINTFLNTTVHSLNTTLNTENTKQNDITLKKQIQPKPFEKEKATYTLDPCSIKQHKDKYKSFIEKELGLTDDEICLKGRPLLEINGAIRTYFQQLVPDEIEEITFWKRYFYWKYNHQLREILISRHTNPTNTEEMDSDKDEEEQEEEEEEEVKLGECENAKTGDAREEINDKGTQKMDITSGNTEEHTSGSKMSETSSWTHVIEDTKSIKEVKEETKENDALEIDMSNGNDVEQQQITHNETIKDVDLGQESISDHEEENDVDDVPLHDEEEDVVSKDDAEDDSENDKKENKEMVDVVTEQKEDKIEKDAKKDDAVKKKVIEEEEESEEEGGDEDWADWD